MDWTARIRLRHLQWLIKLEENGSVSRSAEESALSQPALSRWLKTFEDDVGMPLFERHSKGITLTPYGSALMHHARRVVGDLDRARLEMAELAEGAAGHVSLGVLPVVTPIVPRALIAWQREHPNTRISITEGTIDQLLVRLAEGDIDLLIGRLDDNLYNTGVRCELLHEEPTCVVSGTHHPLAGRQALDWKSLSHYAWIVPPRGTPMRLALQSIFARHGLPFPQAPIESTSFLVNIALLRSSDMLQMVSGELGRQLAADGLLSILMINTSGIARNIGIAWRDDTSLSPVSRTLLEAFQREAQTYSAR